MKQTRATVKILFSSFSNRSNSTFNVICSRYVFNKGKFSLKLYVFMIQRVHGVSTLRCWDTYY